MIRNRRTYEPPGGFVDQNGWHRLPDASFFRVVPIRAGCGPLGKGRAGARLRGNRGLIHSAFRKLRQQDIRLFFFLEALVQRLLVTTQIQLARESCDGAICRDLVMFQLLGRRDQARIAKIVPFSMLSIFSVSFTSACMP